MCAWSDINFALGTSVSARYGVLSSVGNARCDEMMPSPGKKKSVNVSHCQPKRRMSPEEEEASFSEVNSEYKHLITAVAPPDASLNNQSRQGEQAVTSALCFSL